MRGVDHDKFWSWTFRRQNDEDTVERPESARPDEPAIERLVRGIALRNILPLQAIADEIDYAAHRPPVVNTRYAIGQRKVWLQAGHLRLAQQEQLAHHVLPQRKPRIKPPTDPQEI